MRKNSIRDFALAAFVVLVVAAVQTIGPVIPGTHLYGFGTNTFGELGRGNISAAEPSIGAVFGSSRLSQVDGGLTASIAIDAAGHVETWGRNTAMLGYPISANQLTPRLVTALPDIPAVSVSMGRDHALAVLNDGSLYSWGSNGFGQLGRSGTSAPEQVFPLGYSAVSAGTQFSLALDTSGQVVAWGLNNTSQLSGAPGGAPRVVAGLPNIVAIAAGGQHSLALAGDGTVYAWGSNSNLQAGSGPAVIISPAAVVGATDVAAIAAGAFFSVALKHDGTVWTWGQGAMLGNGVPSNSASATQVLQAPGVPITNIVAIAAGDNFALALRNDGRWFGWGANNLGQLGMGGFFSNSLFAVLAPVQPQPVTAIAAGSSHSLVSIGEPSIKATFSSAASVPCNGNLSATLNVQGYSVTGLVDADIMLTLDESGSISATNFAALKQFAANFVNALDISPTATRVGIVMFDNDSRLILAPSDNRTTILNAINGIIQGAGATCIGCGLNESTAALNASPRDGVGRVIVVVTDGINNQPQPDPSSHLAAAIAAAQASSTVVSVGIGAAVDQNELAAIASDVPGLQTVFTTPDYASLDQLIDRLTSTIPTAGATDVSIDLDFLAAWQLQSASSSSSGSGVTRSGNHVSWTLPSLDHTGASLALTLKALSGGSQALLEGVTYADAQSNHAVITNRSINVTGCPASLTLTPAASTGIVNTFHTLTATLTDNFGTPLANTGIRFDIVSGPNFGTLGTVSTNASGVAIQTYTSTTTGTDSIEASLASNALFRSSSASREWLLPNLAPIANAGADQSVTLIGSPLVAVTLDGSASSDDGERQPLSYSWQSDTGFSATGAMAILNLPFGAHTFTLTVDDGELSRTDSVVISVNDLSGPMITADVAGTPGQNGWYVSDISVSFSVDDPETGIVSTNGCAAQAIVDDTLGQTFTCAATNGAGVTLSRDITVRRDATTPIVDAKSDLTGLATSAQGAQVPYSPPGASDATSGLMQSFAQCTPPSNSQFPIGTTLVTCTATDAAGNAGSSTFNITVNDPTPPEIVVNVSGLLGNGGWYRDDVSVSWSVSDPQSGVGSTNGCDSQLLTTDTSGVTFTCTATNYAGGATTESVTVRRDATPPVVTPPADLFAGAVTFDGSNVTYGDATAVDDVSGTVGAVQCAPASGSLFAIGTTPVTCSIDDAAGNTGSASFNVTVADTTPPSITSSVSGTPGSNGWFTSPVQIAWTVSDPQSSVTASGCDPVTLSADAPGVTITCSAASAGGSSSASESVKIDQTAPVIATPGNVSATAIGLTGSNVSYSVSASDATSGLAGAVSCAPASGALFAIGTTAVNCSVSDNAGHSSSASFTVTVDLASNEPGNMHGTGHVIVGDSQVSFDFEVKESAKKGEQGKVDLHIKRGRNGKFDDERFEARAVTDVVFSNAPSYAPGKDSKTGIDTVIFRATGRWDTQDGYSYVATASDRGEPGRGVDTFIIEVKAPNGQVVFSGGGAIADGNVQSNRVKR